MKTRSRVVLAISALAAVYLVSLFLLGLVFERRVEERINKGLGYVLRADQVAIGEVDVSLLRGTIWVREIAAERTGIGTASLKIESLKIEMAGFGRALWNSSLRKVEVVGADLQLSAAGAVTMRRDRSEQDFPVAEFVMRNSRMSLALTTLVPQLARAQLKVSYARTGEVMVKNVLSWLYKTSELDAKLELPGQLAMTVKYAGGVMRVSGGILGTTPISIPFVWPVPDPGELELSQILSLAKTLAARFGPAVAKAKVHTLWNLLVDPP